MKVTITDRSLPCIALFLWCVSLFLPSFLLEGQSVISGLNALLIGLFFGWMYDGWAAYANLFFLYGSIRLLFRKTPWIATLLMLVLLASLPLVDGIPRDEGTDVILEIISWGIGFFIWLMAIFLLVVAVIIKLVSASYKKGLLYSFVILGFCCLLLFLNYIDVRKDANDQERVMFLSKGMLFPSIKMSGVKFSYPEVSLVQYDQVVTIKVDPHLNDTGSDAPYFQLPSIPNYQQGQYKWVTKKLLERGELIVRYPAEQETIVVTAVKNREGVLIQVTDARLQKDIYKTQLTIMQKKGVKYFYPYATHLSLSHGWDSALLRVLGRDQTLRKKKIESLVSSDLGAEDCSFKTTYENNLFIWDGRTVLLGSVDLDYATSICSEKYIYLVNVNWVDSKTMLPYVRVFSRKTLDHLASFGVKGKDFGAGNDGLVKCVRLENDLVYVETIAGANIPVNKIL